MKRTLLAVCGLALAAAPLAAGPVYVPVALNETDGAYRRTVDVFVTNPDSSVQGFVVRYLAASTDGTTREDGDEIGPFYLVPGETKRFNDLVPAGFRGMLELDGATMLQLKGALTARTLQGVKVSEAEVPVLTQYELVSPGQVVFLQGLERFATTITSNVGFVNMGHSPATCHVAVRAKDGILIVQNVTIPLAALSQYQFDDTLAILGLSVVAEGARLETTCTQPFFAYYSTYNDQTGAVEFYEPSATIARSTLEEPSEDTPPPPPPPPGGDAVVFTRPGLVVRYPSQRWALNNYRVSMPFGGSRTFRKVTVDFDFHIGNWDNQRPTGFHCIFWLNNGQSWNNMFGYVNTRGTQSRTVFQVNATGGGWQETTQNGSPQPGGDYHMHYEYDLDADVVFYEITRASGGRVVGREYGIRGTTFQTNSFFIEFGAQHADEGPEAYTPNWTFSDFRAVFD